MAAIVKTVGGLALASVKTVNALAAASLKTINGQDATAGGGPTEIFADALVDGASWADIMPRTGWATVNGAFSCNGSPTDGVSPSTGGVVSCLRRTDSYNANQYSTCTLRLGTGVTILGVSARCQSSSDTHYAVFYDGTNNTLSFYTYNAGAETAGVSVARTYSAGAKLWLEVNGTGSATRFTVKEDTGSGWSAVWTSQDPGGAYIDGGTPGISGYGSALDNELYNWSGGNT